MSIQQAEVTTGGRPSGAPYVTTQDFDTVVGNAAGLVVVDFTADWCPPCRMMAPHIDALARDTAPDTLVVKVDADDEADLAARLGVMGLPTLLFFRDGRVIDRVVGALPPERLRAKVEEFRPT